MVISHTQMYLKKATHKTPQNLTKRDPPQILGGKSCMVKK